MRFAYSRKDFRFRPRFWVVTGYQSEKKSLNVAISSANEKMGASNAIRIRLSGTANVPQFAE